MMQKVEKVEDPENFRTQMKKSNSFTAMQGNIYVGTFYETLTAESNSVFSKIS